MKRNLFVVVVLAILAIPAVSLAAPPRPGPYVSGFFGVSVPQNTDVTFTQFGTTVDTFNDRVEFEPSVFIGGTGGYDFGFVRLEGELSYKRGELDTVTSTGPNPVPPPSTTTTRYTHVDGSLGALAMMFNCFFDLHNDTPVTPYFGGGAGFAALHLSDTFSRGTQLYWSDDDTVFAYQAGAGLEIAINRRLSLDLGYRYFATAQANFNKNWTTETSLKFESHNAAVGFRVKF
jgi:opacity protein-like surface antigen